MRCSNLSGGFRRKAQSRVLWLIGAGLWLLCMNSPAGAQSSQPSAEELDSSLQHAISEVRAEPRIRTQYDYIMTARIRLLLFWAGKDDVGGGYIREGISPENAGQFFEIVMGSDPMKAPMSINRWGAAWELLHRESAQASSSDDTNTFIGFMKVSKGTSVSEMQKELAREKDGGGFLFSAILNQASGTANFAKEVPFQSDRDFTIHQLDQAAPFVFDRLAQSKGKLLSVGRAEIQSCGRSQGFLSSVQELIDDALRGDSNRVSLCYFYNGQHYTLTLEQAVPVAQATVRFSRDKEAHPDEHTYKNLVRLRCENANDTTGKRSNFELLVGTEGDLRGVPVRISYQPNWWFQVVLNLSQTEKPESASSDTH